MADELETTPSAAPEAAAQPTPVLNTIGDLDAAMASARQTANAQQASVERVASEPAPAAANGEPTSRTGRLREQLTQAETARRDVEARFQQRQATDTLVRQKWAVLLGTPEERQRIEATLANPGAGVAEVRQARTRLAQMSQAEQELAPLYASVEQAVFSKYVQGLQDLKALDGMDAADHQRLFNAPSGVEALRVIHAVGRKAAAAAYKSEIDLLRSQVAGLKTQLARGESQPASGRGAPGLASLLGPDGLPTEESIARAKAGGLRHIGRPIS